jgi:hypothetical protein
LARHSREEDLIHTEVLVVLDDEEEVDTELEADVTFVTVVCTVSVILAVVVDVLAWVHLLDQLSRLAAERLGKS